MLIQVVIAMTANNSRLDEPLRLFTYHDFSTNQALPRLYAEMDTKEICLELIREAFLLAKHIDYIKVVDSQERR